MAGLRPGSADNGPVVGEIRPGLIIAAGHFRNGIMLSAATADAVACLLAGERPAAEWLPFTPERYIPGGLYTPGGRPPVDPRQRGETPLSPPSPGGPAQTAGRSIPRASQLPGWGQPHVDPRHGVPVAGLGTPPPPEGPQA
jgi:hypothetical protein